MTGLLVTLGIFIFIFLILMISVTAYVKIDDKVSVSVGALGYKKKLSFEDSEDEEEKPEEEKKKGKIKTATDKVKSEKPTEKSFGETVELVMELIKSLLPKTKNLLSHIRFEKLTLCMTVTSEAADETAIKYGAISAAIYTILGTIASNFKLTVEKIEIAPDFTSEKARYDIYFKVKLRLIFIIGSAFSMFFGVVVLFAKKLIVKKQKPDDTSENI